MKNKYNTGKPIDINELSVGEREEAFREWAEGSQVLEELITEGYKKGLLSIGCCAGNNGNPYIAYILNDEFSRKMAIYVAEQLVNSDLDCSVMIMNNFILNDISPKLFPTRDLTDFNVEAKLENREEVFSLMTKAIREAKLDQVVLPKTEEEIPEKHFEGEEKSPTVLIIRDFKKVEKAIKEKME